MIGRIKRQDKALVRKFVRHMANKNQRRLSDLKEIRISNNRQMSREGYSTHVFYLQDEGAGVISVRQILMDFKRGEF